MPDQTVGSTSTVIASQSEAEDQVRGTLWGRYKVWGMGYGVLSNQPPQLLHIYGVLFVVLGQFPSTMDESVISRIAKLNSYYHPHSF